MNKRIIRTTTIAAALGMAAALAAAPALAQQEGYERSPQQQQQQGQPAEVSEAKLDKFVDALAEIRTIQQEVSVELEAASDTQEAQELQQQAQQKMIEAVQEAGLSVEEYNQIASLMNSDPEIQERIHSKLEQRS